MHQTYHLSNDGTRAILLQSAHNRGGQRSTPQKQEKRSLSEFTSKSYKDSLQRAFNTAKQHIFFNPDMNLFVTLTYAKADNTVDEVLYDVKQFIKGERRRRKESAANVEPKYIFVMEYQKRGSIHVHMIANEFFTVHVNRNGYRSLTYWQKGFSSVLTVEDFDKNFRPYLYLFKYMRKAERIGSSFIHSSRNLKSTYSAGDPNQGLNPALYNVVTDETTKATMPDGSERFFYRKFLEKHDTMNLL